jgi:serine protease Do
MQYLVRSVVGVSCAALLLVPTALPGQGRPRRDATVGPLRQLDDAIESLVQRVSPSVVQVLVTAVGSADAPGRTGVLQQEQVIGSGVIVDSAGFIVTNAHVVRGAERVRVVLAESGEVEGARPLPGPVLGACVIGVDKATDLALLKVDTTGLPALPFGDATHLRKGQVVFAIGSPAGLTNSVTMGVVSSVAREVDPDHPLVYIQTDAPINPGNSGGALVDAEGTLVGLNTFILTEGGGSEGLGFAIPSGIVGFVVGQLRAYGHVHRSVIGIEAQEITPTLAKGLGLTREWGIIVSDVVPGGPAEGAGLHIGDVVVSLNGRALGSLSELVTGVTMRSGGQPVTLEVVRGTQRLRLAVPVVEQRDSLDRLIGSVDPEKNLVRRIGIVGVPIDSANAILIPDLRLPTGVLVLARASYAAGVNSGLAAGDVIHAVNATPIGTLDDLRGALRRFQPGDPVVLQIERQGRLTFLAFEIY